MKKNCLSSLGQTMAVLSLLVFLCGASFPHNSHAANNAVTAMKTGDWVKAAKLLSGMKYDSQTRYALALCSYHLEDPRQAMENAVAALSGEPPLSSDLRAAAIFIVRWATSQLQTTHPSQLQTPGASRINYGLSFEEENSRSLNTDQVMSAKQNRQKAAKEAEKLLRLGEPRINKQWENTGMADQEGLIKLMLEQASYILPIPETLP